MFFPDTSRTGRFILPAIVLLTTGLTVSLLGCGGGGSGGGSTQATLTTTRTAIIEAVQQARVLPSLVSALNAGTTTRSASRDKRGMIATVTARLWSKASDATTRQSSDLEYFPDFGLYARASEGLTSFRYDFFEDANGTQGAGNVTATLTGVNTARVNFDITGGTTPLDGTVNITRIDDTEYRAAGTLRFTETDESVTLDLTSDSDFDATTGDIAVTDDNGTLRYRNLRVASSGGLISDLEYRNATGEITQNPSGSGQARLTLSSSRRYEAVYDANGSGGLTLFDSGGGLEQQIEIIEDFDEL